MIYGISITRRKEKLVIRIFLNECTDIKRTIKLSEFQADTIDLKDDHIIFLKVSRNQEPVWFPE